MEIRKPVKEFEDSYEVSNTGKVRSLSTKKGMWGRELKPLITYRGYCRVALRKNNKPHFKTIHRLVCEHFIENTNNYPAINHINGNKTDNTIGNLEWCTHDQNMTHAKQEMLMPSGENHGRTSLTEQDVHDIRFFCSNRVPKTLISEKYDISIGAIRDIQYGRSWIYMNLPKLKVQREFELSVDDIEKIESLKHLPIRVIHRETNYSRETIRNVFNGYYDNYYKLLKTYFNDIKN